MKAITANNNEAVAQCENNIFLFGAPLICLRDGRTWNEELKGMVSQRKGVDVPTAVTTAWQGVNLDGAGVHYIAHIDDPMFDADFGTTPMQDIFPPQYIPEGYGHLSARQYVSQVIIDGDADVTVIDSFTPTPTDDT